MKDTYYDLNIKKQENVKDDDTTNLELKRDTYNQGYYIQLRCGHNGLPNSVESKILKSLLDSINK